MNRKNYRVTLNLTQEEWACLYSQIQTLGEVQGYEVDVLDYLLKRLSAVRILK